MAARFFKVIQGQSESRSSAFFSVDLRMAGRAWSGRSWFRIACGHVPGERDPRERRFLRMIGARSYLLHSRPKIDRRAGCEKTPYRVVRACGHRVAFQGEEGGDGRARRVPFGHA